MGLLDDLRGVVGPSHVLTDPAVVEGYATDWTGRWRGRAAAVVRPGSTAEVAEALRACAAHGTGVVPQGGNTGLVGGSVPAAGEVVLSTRRLAEIEAVDRAAGTLLAGAGTPLVVAQQAAADAGLAVAIDLAARDSATLGGLVATNAGGERVLRHGTTRRQVLGLEAVLADGSVLRRLSGLPKDNVGYDLTQLLVGSEGTLGVVTRVLLRLVRPAPRHAVALLGLPSVAAAVLALAALEQALPGLEAAELVHDDGLALVCAHRGLPHPLERHHPTYLLVETGGEDDVEDELAEALADLGVEDGVVGTTAEDRRRLWTYREAHTEAVNSLGPPVKLDIAVQRGDLDAFEHRVRKVVAAVTPEARIVTWGHVAEGNVHVNVVGAGDAVTAVADAVLELVLDFGGSISAEHGIGRAKTAWVQRARGPADVAAMRAVKRALDPYGLLNPGVLLPGHPPRAS